MCSKETKEITYTLTSFKPRFVDEYWCNDCDAVVIDSTDTTTGYFFLASGVLFEGDTIGDDFIPITFAICTECLKREE